MKYYIYICVFCVLIFVFFGVDEIRGDEDRVLNQTQMSHYQPKKLENWEDQILNNNNTSSSQFEASNFVDNIIVKQQLHSTNNNILHPTSISSHHTNKFLDFSSHTNNNQDHNTNHLALRAAGPDPDHSSEVRFEFFYNRIVLFLTCHTSVNSLSLAWKRTVVEKPLRRRFYRWSVQEG